MTKEALIIVDMLVDFIDPKGALYCGPTADKIVPFVRQQLDRARQADDLIIYLVDSHRLNDKEFDMFPRHCVKGTKGARVIPELAPKRGEKVVRKTRYSGFFGTRLDEILKIKKVKHAYVVGVCTSICIMDTVGGLRNRDIPTTIYRKGVADFDQKFHRFALQRMQKVYGAEVI
jgi:nicotinamidase-related amidase